MVRACVRVREREQRSRTADAASQRATHYSNQSICMHAVSNIMSHGRTIMSKPQLHDSMAHVNNTTRTGCGTRPKHDTHKVASAGAETRQLDTRRVDD